jgi:hypothetical protein
VKKETHEQKTGEKTQGTVQHESSADNAQEIGLDKSLDTKSEMRNEATTNRKGHNGSDGGNQTPANNH